MTSLFRMLASSNLMLLVIVAIGGHLVDPGGPRRAGFDVLVILATVYCALVHSIVYTYFIAAGKYIQSAMEDHNLGCESHLVRAKANKKMSFRYVLLAILATMTAAFLYYAGNPVRGDGAISPWWAAAGTYVALAVNIMAIPFEWKYIRANSVLTKEVTNGVQQAGQVAPAVKAE
ncbi:MAG: hypothetical protein D8M59_08765 [Planctomycetes bacterium]|nr:hypothetical protein [Planctomycetota bacterium]NOG53910.1 hypothetical protein [Planctomycetota bacterium]